MIVRSPNNGDEWNIYYQLRWEVLRAPWNQPIGSEIDCLEDESFHFAVFEKDKMLGVGRLNIEDDIGKIRFMATIPAAERRGVAKLIVTSLEQKAKSLDIRKIQLNAREIAVPFYIKQGYTKIGVGHLLYDEIRHYVMEKIL